MSFGLAMLGPVVIKFGSEEQKAEILPRILDGTDWWCQGYSEPGAGSDLASLKTRADRDGDQYVINGQKTWTTLGQYANRIFCLVRTDPSAAKPQQGISFVLVDLDTPGIEMRPIRLIEGGHEVNEVFFTDVRVPVANRVGEENEGWTIAKYLLTHERTNIAGVGFSVQAFESLCALAREPRRSGLRLMDDALFAARLARIEVDLEAMKITNLRMLADATRNGAPGPESSMLKIKGTEIRAGAQRPQPPRAGGQPPRRSRQRTSTATPRSSTRTIRLTPRATSTTARSRSTAGPTRCRRTSSPRRCWGSERWTSRRPTTAGCSPTAWAAGWPMPTLSNTATRSPTRPRSMIRRSGPSWPSSASSTRSCPRTGAASAAPASTCSPSSSRWAGRSIPSRSCPRCWPPAC